VTVTRPGQQRINCPVESPLPTPNITHVSTGRISSLQPGFLQSYIELQNRETCYTNSKQSTSGKNSGSSRKPYNLIRDYTERKANVSILFSLFLFQAFPVSITILTQGRMVQPGMECVPCLNTLDLEDSEWTQHLLLEPSRQERARRKNNMFFYWRVACTPIKATLH